MKDIFNSIQPVTSTSGGTSQEDPPTGGTGGGGEVDNLQPGQDRDQQAFCDFSILKMKILQNDPTAPLFKNYPGSINCYVPFLSREKGNIRKEQKITPNKIDSEHLSSRTNAYMSEVVVLYRKMELGEEKDAEDPDIYPVTELNRERIFLSQTVWFKSNKDVPVITQPQVNMQSKEWGKSEYIIHEIRPVYNQHNWVTELTKDNNKLDTLATPINKTNSPEELLKYDYWMVVVRPKKKFMLPYGNKYGIGVVRTLKYSADTSELTAVPQLCQDVKVYGYTKEEADRLGHKPVEIKEKENGEYVVRATFEVVPRIELVPLPQQKKPTDT